MTKVFVLMPFGLKQEYDGGNDESNYVYDEIIKPGVEIALKQCKIIREVDKNRSGCITTSIVKNLAIADIVIVDITGWNPNVFLELGMRYALRSKVTIVLAQEKTEIPFDMKAYRLILYNKFQPKFARNKISNFIQSGMSDNVKSDSIVFDTFKTMSVIIPNIASSHGEECATDGVAMTWDEYMAKIHWVRSWLGSVVNEGRYVPDAIIGISNGGLIVADLLVKAIFAGNNAPILSLWARRYTRQKDYFENEYNLAILQCLKKKVPEGKNASLLLVDDHFGTGNTATQAIAYLIKHLGKNTRILFLPLVSRRKEHFEKVDDYFPYKYKKDGRNLFPIKKEEFIENVNTAASYFPYFDKQVSEGLEQIVIS